jgi:hypothetical protein
MPSAAVQDRRPSRSDPAGSTAVSSEVLSGRGAAGAAGAALGSSGTTACADDDPVGSAGGVSAPAWAPRSAPDPGAATGPMGAAGGAGTGGAGTGGAGTGGAGTAGAAWADGAPGAERGTWVAGAAGTGACLPEANEVAFRAALPGDPAAPTPDGAPTAWCGEGAGARTVAECARPFPGAGG